MGGPRLWTVGRCNNIDMSTDDPRRRTCPGRFILDERPCPRRPEQLASWYALDASVAQRRCGSLVGAQERQKTNGSGTCNACHGEGGSFGCNFSTPTKSDGSPVLYAKAQAQSGYTVWSSPPQHCDIWGASPTQADLHPVTTLSCCFPEGGLTRHRYWPLPLGSSSIQISLENTRIN